MLGVLCRVRGLVSLRARVFVQVSRSFLVWSKEAFNGYIYIIFLEARWMNCGVDFCRRIYTRKSYLRKKEGDFYILNRVAIELNPP